MVDSGCSTIIFRFCLKARCIRHGTNCDRSRQPNQKVSGIAPQNIYRSANLPVYMQMYMYLNLRHIHNRTAL
jgi:hypothetical protein